MSSAISLVYAISNCLSLYRPFSAWDYCYNASPGPTPTASGIELFNNSLDGCGSRGCEKCEGDCDSNADCDGSLTCFFRNGLENVPGCSGGGYEGKAFSVWAMDEQAELTMHIILLVVSNHVPV